MKHLVKHRRRLGFAGLCKFCFFVVSLRASKKFLNRLFNFLELFVYFLVLSIVFHVFLVHLADFDVLVKKNLGTWHPLVPTGLAGRLGHGPASYFDLFWWVIAPEQLRNMSAWPIS